MILIAALLLGWGGADLVRELLSRSDGGLGRWLAPTVGVLVAGGLAVAAFLLNGHGGAEAWPAAIVIGGLWAGWSLDQPVGPRAPRLQLICWVTAVIAAVALSGSFGGAGGDFSRWYRNLALTFPHNATATQALIAGAGGIFLLSTANRVVRMVLDAVGAHRLQGEKQLPGGRYIGVLERLILVTLILSGSVAGAGVVIAAKSVIRLPNLRSSDVNGQPTTDHTGEYFLIGTLTSFALAGALALLILSAQ